jgi:hypothetical protein
MKVVQIQKVFKFEKYSNSEIVHVKKFENNASQILENAKFKICSYFKKV